MVFKDEQKQDSSHVSSRSNYTGYRASVRTIDVRHYSKASSHRHLPKNKEVQDYGFCVRFHDRKSDGQSIGGAYLSKNSKQDHEHQGMFEIAAANEANNKNGFYDHKHHVNRQSPS